LPDRRPIVSTMIALRRVYGGLGSPAISDHIRSGLPTPRSVRWRRLFPGRPLAPPADVFVDMRMY
jgi:hypothetical protein